MRRHPLIAAVSVLVLASCQGDAPPPAAEASGDAPAAPAPDPTTLEGKIAGAMSAAPPAISGAATIVEVNAAGEIVELRAGTNGWLCMPDNPGTPGPDPMCADAVWQQWFHSYMAAEPPTVTAVGTAYMLAGGADASNTDPFATGPAPGESWVMSGPHIMILAPDPAMLEGYPTDPTVGTPYVMWKGTPWAHVMVPVAGH
jgi:hypothetical protein